MNPLDGQVFRPVGAHDSVVGADQGFRAPSWDQESVHDAVHEDSASARMATGQRPRPSFRHPQSGALGLLVVEDSDHRVAISAPDDLEQVGP